MIGCCMSVRVLGQEAAEGWFKAGWWRQDGVLAASCAQEEC
uniref:Uncharacterized protein n=1 Tax=Anguilla anguilla TaxID=7936 RepID=A0A0E9QW51_ANGAN